MVSRKTRKHNAYTEYHNTGYRELGFRLNNVNFLFNKVGLLLITYIEVDFRPFMSILPDYLL